MPQKSSIEWTDLTSNPLKARRKDNGKVGWHCVKWSSGCAHCYAEAINIRFGTGLPFNAHSSDLVELFLNPKEIEAILALRKPSRIFIGDMTDLFQELVTDDLLDQLFRVMAEASRHTFQILTKRPDRMAQYVGRRWSETAADPVWRPLPNVWLGTSVENQKAADERIPHLLRVPAAVRFLSVEPLLGPVDIDNYLFDPNPHREHWPHEKRGLLHWVITGGESGPGARPCDLAWIRSIVWQCKDAEVSCFVKQAGSRWVEDMPPPDRPVIGRWKDPKGGDMAEWPEDLRVREFPREARCSP